MSEPEDKTKIDSEVHLFETPKERVRNDLSRRKDPNPPPAGIPSGLNQVTPPSRDGKVRKVDTDGSKKNHFRTFMLMITTGLVAIFLMNYRVIAGSTYHALAMLDVLSRNLDAAAAHARDAYNINPEDIDSLLLAASIHLGQKKEQLAQEEFALGIKMTKNLPSTYNQRAKILNGQGRTQEALADWNEAIKLNPDYFAAHAQRALIYMKLNEYEKALPDLDAAIKLNPNPNDTYLQTEKQAVEQEIKYRAAQKQNRR